jgi:hypothetical protein
MVKRLAALLTLLLGAALISASPASASAYTWQYQFGNVGGTKIGTVVHPGWQVRTYDIVSGGACHSSWLKFQDSDNNLVNYYAHSDVGACGPYSAWWASGTNGYNMNMSFQWDDGHVVIRGPTGYVWWASPWYQSGGIYRFLVKLGFGCWSEYSAPVQGGAWTKRWQLGSGSGC